MLLTAGRHDRRAGRPRLPARASAALVVALAAVLLAAPQLAGAKQRGIVPPRNPPANVAPSPNYDHCSESGVCSLEPPCYSPSDAPLFNSAACEQQEVAALDNARSQEGVGPLYLPSDFNSLTADEQLLVVIDLERVGRGLPPFAGILASLDRVAQGGAAVSGEAPGTYEDPSFAQGFVVASDTALAFRCKTAAGGYICDGTGEPGDSIAAGGQISALDADYSWMYNDGPGGANGDCRTASARGCWGHRDNILGGYPTKTRFVAPAAGATIALVPRRHATLVMGAGSQQPNGTGGPQGNFTAIFASVVGRTPSFVYTWKQALAAGADAPPT
jgi:hypothetical protein